MKKAQQQIISAIIISGILIGVVGSVYFWGVPLIQKNKDIANQKNSELLMENINSAIIDVTNHGGRKNIEINVPGVIEFNNNEHILTFTIETEGTFYATGSAINLGRNKCTLETGTWGEDEPSNLCVTSTQIGERKFKTIYELKYIDLKSGNNYYKIILDGDNMKAGQNHVLTLENEGTQKQENKINTIISINIL